MLQALNAVPIGKIAYSALIVAVIVFFARELFVVWFDNRIYVGQFQYFAEGKASDELSKTFPVSVLAQHHMLRTALIDETRQRNAQRSADAPAGAETFHRLPPTLPGIDQFQSTLSTLELKIQGFDIGKTLSQLRTWVSPPVEITGFVEKTNGIVRASVNWPHGNATPNAAAPPQFDTGPLSGENSAAFAIAASIVWSQAAQADKNFQNISRDTFVDWALAWWNYRTVRDRVATGAELGDDDKARWKQARKLIDRVIGKAQNYPEIWYLRAEIIEKNPTEKPSEKDLLLAKNDRIQYAVAIGAPSLITAAAIQLITLGVSKEPGSAAEPKGITPPAGTTAPIAELHPGSPIWYKSGEGPGATDIAVTMAAAVERDGTGFVVLPDYVFADSNRSEIVFTFAVDGPVVARAKQTDVVKTEGRGGVALATLEGNVGYSGRHAAGDITIRNVAALPQDGAELRLLSVHGVAAAKLMRTEGGLATTDKRVSRAGDGGAPVIDSDGNLVAMGYLGTKTASEFLPLKPIFDAAKLKLADETKR